MRQVLDYAASSDLSALKKGQSQPTTIATPKGIVKGTLINVDDSTYQLLVPVNKADIGRDLAARSVGWIYLVQTGRRKGFQREAFAGSVCVEQVRKAKKSPAVTRRKAVSEENPGLSGSVPRSRRKRCRSFEWNEAEGELKRTALHDVA